MATKRNARKAKSGSRSKKLGRAKQMKEVKPLAVSQYMLIDGIKGESQAD
jgi:hypothetical protein